MATFDEAQEQAKAGLDQALREQITNGFNRLMTKWQEGGDNSEIEEEFRLGMRRHMLAYMRAFDALMAAGPT